jgi:NADPH:quinone reductase
VSLETAAASLLDYATVDYALHQRAHLQSGELVFILGANGGIGNAAIQLAQRAGATVVAGVSCDARREPAMEKGASMTVDLSSPGWLEELRVVTQSRAPDVVLDPLVGSFTEPAFRSLAKRGRYLVIGFAAQQGIGSLPVNLALLKNANLIGIDIRDLAETDWHAFATRVEMLLRDIQNGALAPPLICHFSLDQAEAAFESLLQGGRQGKPVIVPVNRAAQCDAI